MKVYKRIILIACFIFLIWPDMKGEKIIRGFSLPKPFLTFEDITMVKIPDDYLNLYGRHSIGQSFVNKFSNLCRIGIFVRNPKYQDSGDLIFHLQSSIDSPQDLITLKVAAKNLYDNYYPFMLPPLNTMGRGSFYFFEFKPIADSANRKFYFYLESPESREDNKIEIGYFKNKYARAYAEGLSYRDGRAEDWYLAFQTYSSWKGNIFDAYNIIWQRLIRDINFTVFYIAVCLLLITGIFMVSFKLRLLEE
ncbi:MAG: hypothetical protein HZA27_01825 [Candidatus Omnitrophica bacterium]|nr:hypothetical protein [Candidatus Omnitrophota bacterium]